jgi:elongation factor P
MDMETYEEVRMPRDDSWAVFLNEGTDCSVLFHNGVVISVEPPLNLTLKVTQTDPGVKGNTAQGGTKPATLETGATIQVRSWVLPA